MAEGKKSFIAYSDWYGMFKALPDEVAGKLIKHIFSYVNDENPSSDDFVINALFEQVKSTLKRDLIKWEQQQEQRKNAGIRSAEIRKQNSTTVNERLISSTVSVNDSVSVSVSDSKENNIPPTAKFSFFNSLFNLGIDKQLANDWIAVRKTKKLTNTQTAFNNLKKEFDKCGKPIHVIIEKCVNESWGGFKASWDWKESDKSNNNGIGKTNQKIMTYDD